MRYWIPVALLVLLVVALAVYYGLGSAGGGASTFGLVNSIGLLSVFMGLLAAVVLFRRGSPPR